MVFGAFGRFAGRAFRDGNAGQLTGRHRRTTVGGLERRLQPGAEVVVTTERVRHADVAGED